MWNPYLVSDIESLEMVQRFALRVCLKIGQPVTISYAVKVMSPLFQSGVPCNASDLRQLRDIKSRIAQFQHLFFQELAIALWNSLPHNVLFSLPLSTFKDYLNPNLFLLTLLSWFIPSVSYACILATVTVAIHVITSIITLYRN